MINKPYLLENVRRFRNKNIFSYLEVSTENRQRIELVLSLLNTKDKSKPRVLLDTGCGHGEISQRFLRLGYIVYGQDASKKAVQNACKKNIKAVVGDAEEKLLFPDEYFDVVFAGEIIEHLFDTKKFLSEVYRVMKKGGRLIITTPNLAHLPDRIRLLCGKNPTQVTPLHEYLHLHIRPFTSNTLCEALVQFGFSIKQCQSTCVVFIKKGDTIMLSSRILSRLFPGLGCTLVVSAVKTSNKSVAR